MHACFICDEYPPAPHGGTGSSYCDLAEGLVAAGHVATVVGLYGPKTMAQGRAVDEQINGVRVLRLPGVPRWLGYRLGMLGNRYKLTRCLAGEHRKIRFDVIEASDYGGWLRFGGPPGVPTVIRIRGSNLFFDTELQRPGKQFEHLLERRALARADHLAAVSRYAAERTLKFCGLEQRACAVIPNAVDTALFSPAGQAHTVPGLVVFVNSINPKKGIEQLIGAMNIVCQTHPEAHLVAIGQDTQKRVEGRSYVEWLREQLRPEFRARVAFAGRMPRDSGVLGYLRKANVCCYPSHMETFGIAAVEAMAVGKPTIYSRTGPGPEVIEDGVSGLLCDPFDPEDIAAKICALLDNQVLAAQLGQGARARVLARFNKKDWIGRNLAYYSRCLEKPGKPSSPRPFASA